MTPTADIALAASLVLFGSFGLEKPAALNGPQFLEADVLAEPLAIQGATAHVPAGPGLGIQVDPSQIDRFVVEGEGRALA